MNASSSRIVLVAALVLSACATATPPAPAPATTAASTAARSEVVTEASSFRFHSSFWPNLHHVLYAEAWARRQVPPFESRAGVLPAPLAKADLTASERSAWEQAVDFYERELANKDLLFDDDMGEIRRTLAASDPRSDRPLPDLGAEHARLIAAAAPVYRARWWASHDRANRAWIEETSEHVRSLGAAVPDRLARLYGTPWFRASMRVDVVFVANRQSAYTSTIPGPAHVTVSATDRFTQGWAATEIVFHEASHALVAPVEEAFDAETRAQSKSFPELWHVALFYLTGEVVRQALAARGIEYTPYVYGKGLFARGWTKFQAPLETHWRPYVDGASTLRAAAHDVVAAIAP